MKKRNCTVVKIITATVFLCSGILFCSCKKTPVSNFDTKNKVVIWTDNSEFAQYIELFNKLHPKNNAILVYKENPMLSLPPAKDELTPDIIVGSWLRSSNTKKYFKPLDYLFDRKLLSSEFFYKQLLDAGKIRTRQYLLPVSFNLPAVIFDNTNKDYVTENYTLSLEQLETTGAKYNQKRENGAYTRIGFSPLANNDFLYFTTKIYGADFREEKSHITWNRNGLNSTVENLNNWIVNTNSSVQAEQDFAFKYLFMPSYRQVTSGRTLFAYITSETLFKTQKDLNLNIDYRWIAGNNKIYIEDSFKTLGIYTKSQNQAGATEFIKWFFQTESQQEILLRKDKLKLETAQFGISGGFSSLRDITERVLPLYYNQLLTNLPPAQMLCVPQKLPARWESYTNLVIKPYLEQSLSSGKEESTASIPNLEKEWRKKVFD